jgi:hypothetical protein
MSYEVIPGPAAIRTLQSLPEPERRELADALREELNGGPNAEAEYTFESDGVWYTATPLSFKALTAVHRPLAEDELKRVAQKDGRPAAEHGFFVIEIRSGESAFHIRRTDVTFAPGLDEPPLPDSFRLGLLRTGGRGRRDHFVESERLAPAVKVGLQFLLALPDVV